MSDEVFCELAQLALQEYDLVEYELNYIGQSGTIIYHVTETGNQKQYSLRIHQSLSKGDEKEWSSKETIQSELTWLNALSKEADLQVPAPIRNKKNSFITELNHENSIVYCTLLHWIQGEQKPFIATMEDAAKVGSMIGKLHKQSSKWEAPEGFSRPFFDERKLEGSLRKIKESINNGTLKKSGESLLLAGEKAEKVIMKLEKKQTSWGIIHADLIPSNYIFYEDKVSPIDFGACGFGFYLFDLGWTFSYIHPAFREGFLNSYSSFFELPSNYESLLETFFVLGLLDTLGFWLGLPDSSEWLEGHIDKLLAREFQSYINDKPFLFSGKPYWE